MTKEEFYLIVEDKINMIRKLAEERGNAYATADDRLHNFKRAGQIKGESPERALWGMVVKQLTAVLDNIDRIDKDIELDYKIKDGEYINDILTYMILLQALFWERMGIRFHVPVKIEVNIPKKNVKKK